MSKPSITSHQIIRKERKKKNALGKVLLIVALIACTIELGLRFIVGLGNPPLYEKHKDYGYRLKPNQDIFRFFNNLSTNSFGMRSAEPNPNKKKILKIGDSITNGGMLVDQSKLASSILEQKLNKGETNSYQVLNISAGGWNVANQLEFLKAYGAFSSDIAIIEWNGTDFNGKAIPQQLKAGRFSITSPEEKPFLAITELFQRYIIPQFQSNYYTEDFGSFEEDIKENELNPSIVQMLEWFKSEGIKVIVYLHPNLTEVKANRFDAKSQAIIDNLNNTHANIISGISHMETSFYRDNVHLNTSGHQAMANTIFQYIQQHQILD